MDSVLLITISAFILAVILIIVTIVIIKRNQNKKYKKEIEELDIRKNNLIGVPVLSEITKVKELIKTDNLKNKLDDWDNTFTTIRDEKIPELTDLISEADFLIDRKDYKQAVKKITNIEIEINSLKKKTDHLLEEVKLITNSEERNRALITKLKIVYREDQNKFERSKKEYGVIADYLEKEIDNIDDLFAKFEKAMDNNDYVSVEKKINLLDDKITKLGKLLEDIPTIVLMATVLVPNKIDEAISAYKSSISKNSSKVDAYVNLAICYASKDDYNNAVSILNTAKEKFPANNLVLKTLQNVQKDSTSTKLASASSSYEAKDYKMAVQQYLAINPATEDSMLGAAASYQAMGDYNSAIEYYKRAEKLNPNNTETPYYIGYLYSEQKNWALAEAYLKKALQLNPQSEAKELLSYVVQNGSLTVLNEGIDLYEKNNYQTALLKFNEVLKKEANNAYAYYYRGLIYDEQKQPKLAINDYLNVLKYSNEFPIANYMLAVDYDTLSNYKEAFKYYQKFISSYSTDDEYLKYAKSRLEELRPYAS